MQSEGYLFCNLFQMPDYEVVALRVIERGKAPGVFEGYEVRLLGVVVEMHGAEASDLLPCHLRAVDALLERRGQDCHAVSRCWAVLGDEAAYEWSISGRTPGISFARIPP
jgi:hypothetical protein